LAKAAADKLKISVTDAMARLDAVATRLAAEQGTTPARAVEALAALAVREVCTLLAKDADERVRALMLGHDL